MTTEEIKSLALSQCRGDYQAALIHGSESWSGSTLRGRASSYGAVYARSRTNLIRRIRAALPAGYDAGTDLLLTERDGARRWRRHLVVRAADGTTAVIS